MAVRLGELGPIANGLQTRGGGYLLAEQRAGGLQKLAHAARVGEVGRQLPAGTPAKQKGVTARWVGEEPLSVRCTADPDRVAKALGDGEEIVMKTVELPVAAESKTGKEIVRAANGSIQAAVDTEFVELRWDLDRARRQEAAA